MEHYYYYGQGKPLIEHKMMTAIEYRILQPIMPLNALWNTLLHV